MTQSEQSPPKGRPFLLAVILCFLIVLFFFLFNAPALPIHFGLGWIFYLANTLGSLRLDLSLTAQFIVASFAFLGLGHFLIRSLLLQTASKNPWKFSNSILVLLAIFVSFTAGLAFVGTVHQIGWLAKEPDIFQGGVRDAARRTMSRGNLKNMGSAVAEYHDQWNSFPAGGTLLTHSIPGHSWQTHLLPYIDQQVLFNQIDLQQPWFSPKNKQPFEMEIHSFNNVASYGKRQYVRPSYAISHYAANSQLAELGESISLKDLSDDLSNTLFAGEVVTNFKPWADPTNRRDPTLGLNTSPQGFGGPWKDSATGFLMVDYGKL